MEGFIAQQYYDPINVLKECPVPQWKMDCRRARVEEKKPAREQLQKPRPEVTVVGPLLVVSGEMERMACN